MLKPGERGGRAAPTAFAPETAAPPAAAIAATPSECRTVSPPHAPSGLQQEAASGADERVRPQGGCGSTAGNSCWPCPSARAALPT